MGDPQQREEVLQGNKSIHRAYQRVKEKKRREVITMLDPKIVELTNERIRLEVEELNDRLNEEIAQADSKAASHNMFFSSGHVIAIWKLCVANFQNKAQLLSFA